MRDNKSNFASDLEWQLTVARGRIDQLETENAILREMFEHLKLASLDYMRNLLDKGIIEWGELPAWMQVEVLRQPPDQHY
ncbi:MAG TPA: hypothetical protein VH186_39190 [Chloroflexia bacterium]|nr:hypothetical protein [Chloroflexia bacterium]